MSKKDRIEQITQLTDIMEGTIPPDQIDDLIIMIEDLIERRRGKRHENKGKKGS